MSSTENFSTNQTTQFFLKLHECRRDNRISDRKENSVERESFISFLSASYYQIMNLDMGMEIPGDSHVLECGQQQANADEHELQGRTKDMPMSIPT